MARTQRREEVMRSRISGEIISRLTGRGIDAAHFRIEVKPDEQAKLLDVFLTQTRESLRFPGRIAVRSVLERAFQTVESFLPDFLGEEYRLHLARPSEAVHDGSAETPYGRAWRFTREKPKPG